MITDALILKVFQEALSRISTSDIFFPENEIADNMGAVHNKRSSKFIEIFHDALSQNLPSNFHVLSKAKKAEHFNRNEFLFDVVVVRMKTVKSCFTNSEVKIITDTLLQVESEFALDLNQTMIDFSKLLCGLAPFKIMIMPFFQHDKTVNSWLEQNIFTDEMRRVDSSKYYMAYLPHPKNWIKDQLPHCELYKCENREVSSI